MQQKPVAIALMTCEQVIIEETTRNVTPVNCFSQRTVGDLSSENIPFVVFAVLTDGMGEAQLEVAIQRLDTLDEIYRRSATYRFSNPLHEVRCLFRIRDCSFPVIGHYQIALLADNELVAQRKIYINQKGRSP